MDASDLFSSQRAATITAAGDADKSLEAITAFLVLVADFIANRKDVTVQGQKLENRESH